MENLGRITRSEVRSLDAALSAEHERIVHEARAVAASLARNGAGEGAVERYAGGIAASYGELAAKARRVTRGGAASALGRMARQAHERSDTELAGRERALVAGAEELRLGRDRVLLGYDWRSHWVKAVATWAIVAGDVFLNVYAFTVTGGSLASAIPVALAFALGLWACAAHAPGLIARLVDRGARTLAWLAYASVLALVFLAVALLRARLMALSPADAILGVASWTLLNAFLFLAASLLAASFPSAEQRAAKERRDGYRKEVKATEAEIRAVRRRRDRERASAEAELEGYAERVALEGQYASDLAALAAAAEGMFRSEASLRASYAPRGIHSQQKHVI